MANTSGNSSARQQLYQKELFKDREDKLYFMANGMMGEGEDNIVQVKADLKKEQGDTINFFLTAKLNNQVITGDSEVEGNEEEISSYAESVSINQARQAVRLKGNYDEQRIAYNMREDAKNKLSIYMNEFLERQIFMKLGGVTEVDLTDVGGNVYSLDATFSNSATPVPAADEAAGSGTRYICSDAAGLDSLAATDILTTDLITRAKVKAQVGSGGVPRIKPVRIKGKDYFIMFIHPWQAADLKTDSSSKWYAANRDAQVRGDDNPLFTGALGVWDGVIIHEHEYVPTCQASSNFDGSGTAAGAQAFRSLLCGCQAAVMAETNKSMLMIEKAFDYENKMGYAINFIGGVQKPTFNSIDYGVVTVDTGATNLG